MTDNQGALPASGARALLGALPGVGAAVIRIGGDRNGSIPRAEGAGTRLADRLWSGRYGMQALLDIAAWTAALLGTWALPDEPVPPATAVLMIGVAILVQTVLGRAMGLYRSRYVYASFSETGSMGAVALVTGLVLVGATLSRPVPALAATFAAIVMMSGSRYLMRLAHDRMMRPDGAEPVVVVGAGDAGLAIIRQMITDRESPYIPVGIVDDDPGKRFLRISGVRVFGTTADLAGVVRRVGARGVVVAIAGTDSEFLCECRERLAPTGAWLRTIPSIAELVNRRVELDDIRSLDVEDLIGRRPSDIDLDEIGRTIAGRRVLVTGAGGSIGSELCRQLHGFGPASLVMLDRDETALHGVELSIRGSALLTSQDTVLADIRDRAALDRIFAAARPEVVFHAAALKHLPMLQRFPLEGWKTNVHGTLNVLAAARAAGVSTFVNISTDKAADPTSELGRSKRMGERLVADFARTSPGTYLSVRFGNVLGSRGSVLLSFREQLHHGGPLTVTHPEVTRYFMTIPEACQLVLQAQAMGEDGCVMVLDMGEPVRIVDIAKKLIALSGSNAEIVFTGLRPGEKLDEALFGDRECADVQVHERISRVRVPALDPARLPPPHAPEDGVGEFVDAACAVRGPSAQADRVPALPASALPASAKAQAAPAAFPAAPALPAEALTGEVAEHVA